VYGQLVGVWAVVGEGVDQWRWRVGSDGVDKKSHTDDEVGEDSGMGNRSADDGAPVERPTLKRTATWGCGAQGMREILVGKSLNRRSEERWFTHV
jgi:hypothetical protein